MALALEALTGGGCPANMRMRRVAWRLALEAQLVEVAEALTRGGAMPIVLKGAAFAHWLYDDPSERVYSDIDLLVDVECANVASRVLVELGYTRFGDGLHAHERTTHHTVWQPPSGRRGARVELHHTLFLLDAPPALVWRRLSAGARPVRLAVRTVYVPAEPSSALIVALHAAQHGIAGQRWIEDLERALDRASDAAWCAAASLARELGAIDAFASGLRLTGAGRTLADRLGVEASTARAVRLRAATAPGTAIAIERLISAPGLWPRLRLLGCGLMPSPDFMRSTYPGAGRGRAGLAVAYLSRPFRVAATLPAGLRAWVRVARADRSWRR